MAYYLRMGNDVLNDAVKHTTKTDAIASYRDTSDDLDRFGQSITNSIHIADSMDDIVEYPDFVLERGPRGGVKVERA